jgi:hypothetical protein
MTPAKPPFEQFSESLSRTTEDKDVAMAVARNILDQDGENGYICLSEMTKTGIRSAKYILCRIG